MDKFEELKQIFKGILTDLEFTNQQIVSITSLLRTPQEMSVIVDAIDKNPNIKYEELFEIVINSINFDIEINN